MLGRGEGVYLFGSLFLSNCRYLRSWVTQNLPLIWSPFFFLSFELHSTHPLHKHAVALFVPLNSTPACCCIVTHQSLILVVFFISPAFISRDVDIAITARRLAFGKFFNCGQTCIAPDYLIVERGIEDKLIEAFKASILEFYGTSVQSSNSYGRIVNKSHFQRLKGLLDETKGKIVAGGELDEDNLFISPTLVLGVDKDDKLMEGEIFGPILPLMVVDRLVEGVKYVNQGDQPLALYVFSKNKKAIDYILDHTRSGGVVVNDALVHFIVSNLPFGGTGPSGIGNYHGKRSFDVFSHERSALIKSMGMEKLNDLRYPVGYLTSLRDLAYRRVPQCIRYYSMVSNTLFTHNFQ